MNDKDAKSIGAEAIYQSALKEAEPLIDELVGVLREYPLGVGLIGAAAAFAEQTKHRGIDVHVCLSVLLRSTVPHWTGEETLYALKSITAALEQGMRILSGDEIHMN